jgi:hypothetical protein
VQARPDRLLIYPALALVAAAIAGSIGPFAGLLTLLQVVVVVEGVSRLGAPGNHCDDSATGE